MDYQKETGRDAYGGKEKDALKGREEPGSRIHQWLMMVMLKY